ncbi:hypothetical protein [Vibrio coralliilyticus]|uniref:hypothetical protein n=1 Tax=Vibrio coralliilyticus TaxID=190893 RepID=UPI000B0F57CA|nr:hypothetical protein [Vibrio coralliilyticus]
MKYTNQQKTAVLCRHPVSGDEWTVPRGHRFWSEFGIDEAEQKGQIEEADVQAAS